MRQQGMRGQGWHFGKKSMVGRLRREWGGVEPAGSVVVPAGVGFVGRG